jgi:hypothetical protein
VVDRTRLESGRTLTGTGSSNLPLSASHPYGRFRPLIPRCHPLACQADAFNVNNAVHFGTPGLNIDTAAFGKVTTMANQPRKLQFSGRVSF